MAGTSRPRGSGRTTPTPCRKRRCSIWASRSCPLERGVRFRSGELETVLPATFDCRPAASRGLSGNALDVAAGPNLLDLLPHQARPIGSNAKSSQMTKPHHIDFMLLKRLRLVLHAVLKQRSQSIEARANGVGRRRTTRSRCRRGPLRCRPRDSSGAVRRVYKAPTSEAVIGLTVTGRSRRGWASYAPVQTPKDKTSTGRCRKAPEIRWRPAIAGIQKLQRAQNCRANKRSVQGIEPRHPSTSP